MISGLEGIEPLPTGRIYSIEVGQPKNGFRYRVGQTFPFGKGKDADTVEIIEIIRDDNAFHLTGVVRYIMYCQLNGDGELFSWKYYDNVPISVTCFAEE
jgi:hypothetical protein